MPPPQVKKARSEMRTSGIYFLACRDHVGTNDRAEMRDCQGSRLSSWYGAQISAQGPGSAYRRSGGDNILEPCATNRVCETGGNISVFSVSEIVMMILIYCVTNESIELPPVFE